MIKLIQGFDVGSPLPIDGRILLSRNEMANIDDNIMPNKYFCICEEDGLLYLYDKSSAGEFGKFYKAVPESTSQLINDGNGGESSEDAFDTIKNVNIKDAIINARIDDVIASTSEGFIDNEKFENVLTKLGLWNSVDPESSDDTVQIGNKLYIDYDDKTYQFKVLLKNHNNEVISETNVIDLPIESLILSIEYESDSEGGHLVIRYANDSSESSEDDVIVPLHDIVRGLVNETTFNDHVDDVYLYDLDEEDRDNKSYHITFAKGQEWDNLKASFDELTSEGISYDSLNENVQQSLDKANNAVLVGDSTSLLINDGEDSESGKYITENYFKDNVFNGYSTYDSSEDEYVYHDEGGYIKAGNNVIVKDKEDSEGAYKEISAHSRRYIALPDSGVTITKDEEQSTTEEDVYKINATGAAPTWTAIQSSYVDPITQEVVHTPPTANNDLMAVFDTKQDKLIAGDYIDISSEGVISGTGYDLASSEEDGLLSSTDFVKLQGIATGAEVNVQANWDETSEGSDAFIQNKPDIKSFGKIRINEDLVEAVESDDEVEFEAGNNVVLDVNSDGSIVIGTSINTATTESEGLMSASDKSKLDGIASGAEVNVKADWSETSEGSDAFILNKPFTSLESTVTTSNNPVTASGIKTYVDDSIDYLEDYVDTAVADNAATFRGVFEDASYLSSFAPSAADSQLKTNDYAFVIDGSENADYSKYMYNAAVSEWRYIATYPSTAFTPSQWAAINSGIDSSFVSAITVAQTDIINIQSSITSINNDKVSIGWLNTINSSPLYSSTAAGDVQVGTVRTINGDSWISASASGSAYNIAHISHFDIGTDNTSVARLGPSQNANIAFGGTISIPGFFYDRTGHLSSNVSTYTATIPSIAAGDGVAFNVSDNITTISTNLSAGNGISFTTSDSVITISNNLSAGTGISITNSAMTTISGVTQHFVTVTMPKFTSAGNSSVTVTGITSSDHPIVDLYMTTFASAALDDWANIYRVVANNGTVSFYAAAATTASRSVNITWVS